MAWATAEDVQQLTGKTVDDTLIDQATAVIEMTQGGRVSSLGTTTVSARNLYWLKLAVAYQAAWMDAQPDYFERMDVDTFTQDGASATLRPDGLRLAPLARTALKRLSWRGMRTIHASTGRLRVGFYSDTADDHLHYRPL
jgi:hypothetical protein